MPINATPTPGLSDHIEDVRSHTGRGVGGRVVTGWSLPRRPFTSRAPEDAHRILAKHVLHHYKNESWGCGG